MNHKRFFDRTRASSLTSFEGCRRLAFAARWGPFRTSHLSGSKWHENCTGSATMLRLVVKNEGPGKTVEIHGDLAQEALYELDRECRLRSGLVINLSNLRQIDAPSAVRLRKLSLSGAKLVGASRYVSMLIESEID